MNRQATTENSQIETKCVQGQKDPLLTPKDDDDNGTHNGYQQNSRFFAGVAVLCLASLANGLIIVSVFPYAGFLVLKVLPNTTPETAGTYAGWIAASFMAGRFGTAYLWGSLADTYGRVVVLKVSLYLSAICSIWFGVSTTFAGAIFSRFCLGMANAITSTTKVLASEIAHGDTSRERQAMGLTIGMRSWGFLLGPAIGGLLADPIKQYPEWFLFNENDNTSMNISGDASATKFSYTSKSGYYSNLIWLLSTYPFILPNLVIALTCLFSAIASPIFLSETLNDLQDFTIHSLWKIICEECSSSVAAVTICCPRNTETTPLLSVQNYSSNTAAVIATADAAEAEKEPSVWSRINTRQHMICTWVFSFAVTVIDEAFPLFCISAAGGLGLVEASIGRILSFAGLLFALLQYIVYIQTVQRYGLYSSIEVGCLLGLLPVSLIPLSLFLNSDDGKWYNFAFLGALLGGSKIFTCMCFSSLAIATNKTAPASQRARMNGLVLLGGSVAKGLGPVFAGFLVALSFSFLPYPFGSILIFGTIGLLGIISFIALRGLKNFSDNSL